MHDALITDECVTALESCLGGPVPPDVGARLAALAELVGRWTQRINLIAPASVPDIWQRHIVDSAQLFRLAPDTARHWADLGSGAGFPGLVIASIAADVSPGLHVTLVESDARKVAFLGTAARSLGLDVTIRRARAEGLAPLEADIVSARALAPLPRLLELVHRHMNSHGCAVLPKGATHASELAAARQSWHFSVRSIVSRTNPAAVILIIEDLSRD